MCYAIKEIIQLGVGFILTYKATHVTDKFLITILLDWNQHYLANGMCINIIWYYIGHGATDSQLYICHLQHQYSDDDDMSDIPTYSRDLI